MPVITAADLRHVELSMVAMMMERLKRKQKGGSAWCLPGDHADLLNTYVAALAAPGIERDVMKSLRKGSLVIIQSGGARVHWITEILRPLYPQLSTLGIFEKGRQYETYLIVAHEPYIPTGGGNRKFAVLVSRPKQAYLNLDNYHYSTFTSHCVHRNPNKTESLESLRLQFRRMPSLIATRSSRINGEHEDLEKNICSEAPAVGEVSPSRKRRFGSENPISSPSKQSSPAKWKSPRRSVTASPKTPMNVNPEQISAVKEALHVSTAPSAILCREDEQTRLLEFCKECIANGKSGSLYACGCPGTGKTLSMEKVKELLLNWVKEILAVLQLQKKTSSSSSPLHQLQKLFSQKKQASDKKMILIVADEMDYLITKDCSVLHELFLLTSLPSSRCKPTVLTFRAYSKDHILRILRQRLMVLPCDVFQEEALELCARKIAAASGDMRKALFVCRSAVEMLEAEVVDSSSKMCLVQANGASPDQSLSRTIKLLAKDENIVRIDHMAVALSKTFKSAIVDTVQSLPQHQQMVLCSIVKLFQRSKKDTTIAELNRSYSEICKSVVIPPASALEFSTMCKVLSDQGLFKLGQSREDRLKRVTLKVDEAEIKFALQNAYAVLIRENS
ncbi:hypothetical protein Syun_000318 [Stephania yunnanensis]|uniref:Cdc6 C-terminal domain-containing protein n=1 Tax=Stephania yunnanensis TaxID=152371 RepID=A0AAP0LBS7_9MAGN